MMTKRFFWVFSLALILNACDSNTYSELEPIVENPTYNTNIKLLIDSKCISCHNSNGEYLLTNYNSVKTATQNGNLLFRIKGNCGEVMPPSGRLPQAKIDMVDLWKSQGYIEQ